MDKFKNKYRIASSRAQWWDYGINASYFITICTKNREYYFGEISANKMHLSHTGLLADVFWQEINQHAKNVELDAYVVMPNHIHGILILNKDVNFDKEGNNTGRETRHALSLPHQKKLILNISLKRFQNQGKNTISSIIGSYKSAVTKHANRLGLEFGWQQRFHDHIIRNKAEFLKISNYIENNAANWATDKFYKQVPND